MWRRLASLYDGWQCRSLRTFPWWTRIFFWWTVRSRNEELLANFAVSTACEIGVRSCGDHWTLRCCMGQRWPTNGPFAWRRSEVRRISDIHFQLICFVDDMLACACWIFFRQWIKVRAIFGSLALRWEMRSPGRTKLGLQRGVAVPWTQCRRLSISIRKWERYLDRCLLLLLWTIAIKGPSIRVGEHMLKT